MPNFEQQPKKSETLTIETPEQEAERLKTSSTETLSVSEDAQEIKQAVEDQARADEQAAQEVLRKIQGESNVEPSISETEMATAFDEASLMNQYIDNRSAQGKPLDAAAFERLRQVSSEEMDKKIAVLNTEEGKKRYLSNEGVTRAESESVSKETAQESLADPEVVQAGNEALAYVMSPDDESTEHLTLDNRQAFERALEFKKVANRESRKKIWQTSLGVGATSAAGGITAMSFGVAGSTAALYGTAALFGGGGIVALGALGYGAKKLYDRYKERKAEKNFTAARAQAR